MSEQTLQQKQLASLRTAARRLAAANRKPAPPPAQAGASKPFFSACKVSRPAGYCPEWN